MLDAYQTVKTLTVIVVGLLTVPRWYSHVLPKLCLLLACVVVGSILCDVSSVRPLYSHAHY